MSLKTAAILPTEKQWAEACSRRRWRKARKTDWRAHRHQPRRDGKRATPPFQACDSPPVYRRRSSGGLERRPVPTIPARRHTRGIHASGYRGKMWTMRQSRASHRPRRLTSAKYLLEHGEPWTVGGVRLADIDGYDSDHAMSEGEVGKRRCDRSLEDMEILFDGID